MRPLMSLQNMVYHLVRTSGLFNHESGNSHRLQTLRQQYHFETSSTHKCGRRCTLTEWDPVPKQAVQESPPTNALKPPDPEWEEFSILARITVLMAGAIFGAILLYLCRRYPGISTTSVQSNKMAVSRYGYSTLCLPIVTWDDGQSWAASDQILARNRAILAKYIGLASSVDFESWESSDHLLPKPSPLSHVLPDSLPAECVWEHMTAVQAPHEGDYPMIDFFR